MIIDDYKDFYVLPEMINNGRFNRKLPEIVKGNFSCTGLELTTLEGGPLVVGSFNCSNNKLTSLKGCPRTINEFNCANNLLTSLEGSPKSVENFYCSYNRLTTLKGGPKYTNDFYCKHNKLTNLEYFPHVNGFFDPSNNYYNLNIELEYVLFNMNAKVPNHGEEYWLNLLKYTLKMDKNSALIIPHKGLEPYEIVKGWPKGFLNSALIQSLIGINKFNL